MEHIWIKPLLNTDFNVIQYGEEACSARHSFGPAVRDHFLLHLVLEGKGRFSAGGREYTLQSGEGFLIFPHEVAYYEADESQPWTYIWIGFRGDEKLPRELGISPENPIFVFSEAARVREIYADIESVDVKRAEGQLRLLGNLFMLLAELEGASQKDAAPSRNVGVHRDYVEHAIQYIQQNYALRLTVADIAAHLGIHRSYFSTVFREHTKMSPQEFLLWVRTDRACALLKESDLSILGVAHSVGYEDALLFSRMFKRRTGLSPREYRKRYADK